MRLVIALAALATSGCSFLEKQEIANCEALIERNLKAPSTYKRMRAERTLMTTLTPREIWVSIEYDAQNAYGVPLRGNELCKYPADKNGNVDWAKFDAELTKRIEAAADPLAPSLDPLP